MVMGVLNVTPDSFSDGGAWFDQDRAVDHGLQLVADGADVVDVGGESTRPGAGPVPVEEELRRVLPVVDALAGRVRISVDTRKPEVADAALAAGATILNDVSARLWPVAARHGAGWIAMHMPADPTVMDRHAHYDDVVAEVTGYLVARAAEARAGGVGEVWIDPGLGFGKTAAHNLLILRHLDRLVATGWPVVVGASRKSFLGRLTARGGVVPPPADRLEASVAAAAWAVRQGAAMVRAHDVAPTRMLVTLATPGPDPTAGRPPGPGAAEQDPGRQDPTATGAAR